MDEKIVKTYMFSQNMLLSKVESILVACSGGADSVALLSVLRELEGVSIVCAHFNHRLRGEESDRDEAFVRTLCKSWGLPFFAGSGDVTGYARAKGMGIEEAARTLRYRFLLDTARENACAAVATAHTANDNAETVLFHLIRGAGTRGLGGIPPVRELGAGVRLIRPLLNVTRGEVELYLAARGLSHVEDSSNADERYARNALRRNILPALERLNSAAVSHICSAAELLREDEAYFDNLASTFLAGQCRDGAVPIAALRGLPKPVAMRVLSALTNNPGREHLERAYALCLKDGGRSLLDLPGGRAERRGGYFRFGASREETAFSLPERVLISGSVTDLPELGMYVIYEKAKNYEEIHNSFNTFYFQNENICGTISVASCRQGEKVRLAGRGCTKPLRRLFAEAGIPPERRSRVPVLYDAHGVIAVYGFGAAERCAAKPGDKAIRVEICVRDERGQDE